MSGKPLGWKPVCVSLGIMFFSMSTAFAASTSAIPPGAIEQARALLEREIASKVPGASVAVMVDASLAWSECFGYADLAAHRRVTPETRFRLGSISKSLTSAGLALLVERNLVDLDVPIQTYLPDFPRKEQLITLRMLAGHLSGIRDYRDNEALSTITYPDSQSRLKVFENDSLIAPPGKKFSYASYNWVVIEAAIERAAHQDFVIYMDNAVLKPLHLRHTRAEQSGTDDPQQVQFYETDATGAFILGPPIEVGHAWAAQGYLSTAEDLAEFGSALLHPGFLRESSRQLLFTSQKTTDNEATGYGVGWYVYPQPKVIYHTGWTVGGLSILLMLPDENVVVAILTNRGDLNLTEKSPLHFNLEDVAFRLARVFTPASPDAPSAGETKR